MRDRRKLLIAGGAVLALMAVQRPTADIRLITHSVGDPNPQRVQAAVDLGLMAVSVLVTWTSQRLGG
ncbi:hypothetical protein [Sphingomonas lenta]|uniref:Uncharacterized protein n=1 Tax=Sphingomonas lenta TaxID=1141887 RepID=A0A2A2SGP9_9SPHN|nr:hypothetical protein [Sphingomonas lenta]PAX08398.1 hypothetical protein CKY28_11750 [Sphingomonas lenta]